MQSHPRRLVIRQGDRTTRRAGIERTGSIPLEVRPAGHRVGGEFARESWAARARLPNLVNHAMAETRSTPGFPTTHWSRVVAAGDREAAGAGEALAELCAAYWYPRLRLHPPQGARPRRGRRPDPGLLRPPAGEGAPWPPPTRARAASAPSCGPTARFFLADRRDRDGALKRGGGRPGLDRRPDAEGRYRGRAGRRADPRAALRPRLGPEPARPASSSGSRREYAAAGQADAVRGAEGRPDRRPPRRALRRARRRLGTTEGAVAGGRPPAPQALPGAAPRADRRDGRRPGRRSTTRSATCSPPSGLSRARENPSDPA